MTLTTPTAQRQWHELDSVVARRKGPSYDGLDPTEMAIAQKVWSTIKDNCGWATSNFCVSDPVETALWDPRDAMTIEHVLIELEEIFELPNDFTRNFDVKRPLGDLVRLIASGQPKHLE